MTIDELRDEMTNRFERTDARVERTETRISELRDDMIVRFERIDSEFVKMRAEMKAGQETTRRHFEVWAEKMNDSIKIVAEATAHQTVRIDDHEKRLKRVERLRPRRTE